MINRDVEEKMPVANASPMYILVHPTQLFNLMEVKQQSLFPRFLMVIKTSPEFQNVFTRVQISKTYNCSKLLC